MKKLVHNRKISIRTFDLGDYHLLVEGRLLDHRYSPAHNKASEDPQHHMVIRLNVKGPEMLIERAEATMPRYAREGCPEVLPWIRNLEGLRIAPGFSMKVKELIGGIKGCAHLTSLVVAMGPSAVQGFWAAYGAERGKMGPREQASRNAVNTCYVWREDGPLVKGLTEALES